MNTSSLGVQITHLTKLGRAPKITVFFIFAFAVIVTLACYLTSALSFVESISLLIFSIVVCLILYAVFAFFSRNNTDITLFEKGLIIKKGKQQLTYLYNQIKNLYLFPDQHGFLAVISLQMNDDKTYYSSNKLGGGNKNTWLQYYINEVFEQNLDSLNQNQSLCFEYMENRNTLKNFLMGRNYSKHLDSQKKSIVLTKSQIQFNDVNVYPYTQLQEVKLNEWKKTISITDTYGNEVFLNDYHSLSQYPLLINLIEYLISNSKH